MNEWLNHPLARLAAAAIVPAIGVWLLLPRGRGGALPIRLATRLAGAALILAGVVACAWSVPRLGDWLADATFLLLAGVTVAAALATVTLRNPVYSAIWFALSLLGIAGLLFFQGAQFLGVATVVVYAGAILVTFLFVLMLAQPKGEAFYDRLSWEGFFSAVTAAVLVGLLTANIGRSLSTTTGDDPAATSAWLVAPPTDSQRDGNVLSENHTGRLGGVLFSKHLLAVEVAGTLLLAALVGAIAIVAHGKGASSSRREAAP